LNVTHSAFLRAWQGLVVLLALAIAAGSLLPMPSVTVTGGVDKLEHFAGYFALALLGSGIVQPPRLWVVMARCFAFGLGIELLQAVATDYRTADGGDVIANTLGLAAAWVIAGGGRAGWARHVEDWLARRFRS
jgi:VanZ family protein